ncbi:hypothetical protein R1flu_009444 [Riccia fluitans]|uniref:Uncharacterized protein n=1 Tax=Riccia fluitans TaxID=41844 RepID=A0ABD1Z548_9MARC
MSKEQQKANLLPQTFQQGWFELIDSFERRKHTIEPVCVLESMEDLLEDESHQQHPNSFAIELEEAPKEQDTEANSKANFGIKIWKKSKALVDDFLVQSMSTMTDRICKVEDAKLEFLRQCETRKLEVVTDQVASIRE